MESVVAALVTGVLTLAGVLVSNSRSRAVMEVKIDNLTRQVEGTAASSSAPATLEQDVAVVMVPGRRPTVASRTSNHALAHYPAKQFLRAADKEPELLEERSWLEDPRRSTTSAFYAAQDASPQYPRWHRQQARARATRPQESVS